MATPPNRAYLTVANAFAQICSANAPQTSDTLGTLHAKTLEIKVKRCMKEKEAGNKRKRGKEAKIAASKRLIH